ncbi:hypothetical protein A4H97_13995 [Niastella yeongjuensis]|uniref:Uncharacterized protein n=1 Tax=Niastella yeongjuensis TaxID=354355 RepID=A0A1V9E3R5_9BACT|nr:efflux RND transporter periplasmic adaptor subunit [Niastella yeongjuensis]OQP40729.1 hypothetical protein A4H97_13995 [Niastella yeongjuensis]SEP03428.1 RND family efflux transporter, MFP subunit [Niastella yeongjuensis]
MNINSANTIITIACVFGVACSSPSKEKEPVHKTAPATPPAASVTFELTNGSVHTDLVIPAELSAYREVDLYAKVNSYVRTLSVDVGSFVKKGQLLATLEAPELISQLAATESRYKAQQAIYESSNATYQRILDASTTPGTISKNDVDIALAKRNSDRAQMEAAMADYKANTTVTQYLVIRAPFDGVISARNVNLGAYMGPSGKGSELPIFTLQQQQHLRLILQIPEAYKNLIKLNDVVNFTVKAFPDRVFSAEIARRAGVMNKKLRSEHVELDVLNDGLQLSPGMVAEAVIGLNTGSTGFAVPKGAVVNSTDGVFMIEDSSGYAKRVPVRLGRSSDSLAEVFGKGLVPGRRFVRNGSEEIRHGYALH